MFLASAEEILEKEELLNVQEKNHSSDMSLFNGRFLATRSF